MNIHVHKYLFTGRDGSLLSLKWVDFEFDELPSSTHHYTSWCKNSITKNHWISLDYWKFKCNLHLLEHYFFDWLLWVIDSLLFDQTFIENAPDFSVYKLQVVTVINSCSDQISLAEMYRKKWLSNPGSIR